MTISTGAKEDVLVQINDQDLFRGSIIGYNFKAETPPRYLNFSSHITYKGKVNDTGNVKLAYSDGQSFWLITQQMVSFIDGRGRKVASLQVNPEPGYNPVAACSSANGTMLLFQSEAKDTLKFVAINNNY